MSDRAGSCSACFQLARYVEALAGSLRYDTTPAMNVAREYPQHRFAVCINNQGYEDDLKVRSVYRVMPDESAARSNYLRIQDENGEDYLYPADFFVMIEVPSDKEEALLNASTLV